MSSKIPPAAKGRLPSSPTSSSATSTTPNPNPNPNLNTTANAINTTDTDHPAPLPLPHRRRTSRQRAANRKHNHGHDHGHDHDHDHDHVAKRRVRMAEKKELDDTLRKYDARIELLERRTEVMMQELGYDVNVPWPPDGLALDEIDQFLAAASRANATANASQTRNATCTAGHSMAGVTPPADGMDLTRDHSFQEPERPHWFGDRF